MAEENHPDELSIEEKKLAFEYARLAQDKYFKEKELEYQKLVSRKTVWTTPWITALVAGIIGLLGTLWNSLQSLSIERKKQEGVLILEAIKTGTGETKRAAANLVFLDKSGLIQLSKEQLMELEKEAGINSLPSLPAVKETINYEPSKELTPGMKETLQNTIDSYLSYLSGIGYQKNKKELKVFINPELQDNIVYDIELERLEIPPVLVNSKDGVLQQYSTRIIIESGSEKLWQDTLPIVNSLLIGLSDYFTCSYQDDPILGEDFVNANTNNQDRPYLRHLINSKPLNKTSENPYDLGEAWGGAFWEMRSKMGKLISDKILFSACMKITTNKVKDSNGVFFIKEILQTDKDLNNGRNLNIIKPIFTKRGLIIAN